MHATLTARDFFLAYIYPSGPFICIFPKPLPIFPVSALANTWLLCWLWLAHGFCVGPQSKKKVTLPDAGSCVECPRNINRLKRT